MELVEGSGVYGPWQAAALGRDAVMRFPDSPNSWSLLAHALYKLGDSTGARACVEEGIAHCPGDPVLREMHARSTLALGDAEGALAELNALAPEAAESDDRRMLAGEALAVAEDWPALEAFLAATERTPGNTNMLIELTARLGAARRYGEDVLALCDAVLAETPAHTSATYYKARVLALLGRPAEARAAMKAEGHIAIRDLPPPPGFADGARFHAALAREIVENPTLIPDPRRKATEGGMQTMQLRRPGARATEALIAQIRSEVQAHIARLQGIGSDFVRATPETAELVSWAVIYKPEGHQRAHHHADGWLSGVYYVAAPRARGDNRYRGGLRLGALDDAGGAPWEVLDIEPVPGRLVLFPSYVPHDTEPTGVDGDRISVAFDITPVAA